MLHTTQLCMAVLVGAKIHKSALGGSCNYFSTTNISITTTVTRTIKSIACDVSTHSVQARARSSTIKRTIKHDQAHDQARSIKRTMQAHDQARARSGSLSPCRLTIVTALASVCRLVFWFAIGITTTVKAAVSASGLVGTWTLSSFIAWRLIHPQGAEAAGTGLRSFPWIRFFHQESGTAA